MLTWLSLKDKIESTDLSLEESAITGTITNASKVAVLRSTTLQVEKFAEVNAEGVWEAYIKPGSYYVAAFADGCQPLLHGPLVINE